MGKKAYTIEPTDNNSSYNKCLVITNEYIYHVLWLRVSERTRRGSKLLQSERGVRLWYDKGGLDSQI